METELGCMSKSLKKLHANLKYRGYCITTWIDDPQQFFTWALENGYKEGKVLARYYENLVHSPENSYFLDKGEYFAKKKGSIPVTLHGIRMSLTEAHRKESPPEVSYALVRSRVDVLGWELIDALTRLPAATGRKRKEIK